MNVERYRMVMHRIWADLRTHNQAHYHHSERRHMRGWHGEDEFVERTPQHECGTTHCVAGWAQILSGRTGPCNEVAREWLGIDYEEALWLFHHFRSRADLAEVLRRGRVFE